MEELTQDQHERLERSNELIADAMAGRAIDESRLNPLDTSSETVGYVKQIQILKGRTILNASQLST